MTSVAGRWHDRSGPLETVTGEETSSPDASGLHQIATATRHGGAPPEIALVYALGPPPWEH